MEAGTYKDMDYDETTGILRFKPENEEFRQGLLIDKTKTVENTLVQYSEPVLVGHERRDHSILFYHVNKHSSGYGKDADLGINRATHAIPFCKKEEEDRTDVQVLLKRIFPPLEWISARTFWRQSISAELVRPRIDDVRLDNDLINMLDAQGAKLSFVCSTRRQIYDQLFDELLRRTLLESPARGYLLLQCRDQLRAALKLETEMFYSHSAYNFRRGIQVRALLRSEKDRKEQERRDRKKLIEEGKGLMEKIATLKAEIKAQKDELSLKHKRELDALKADNERTKMQLKTFVDSRNFMHKDEIPVLPAPKKEMEPIQKEETEAQILNELSE